MQLSGLTNLTKITKVFQHQLIDLISGDEILLPLISHLIDEMVEEINIKQCMKILSGQL
ncbi:hypothetical protein D3C85_555730 [compost metagenome]